MIVCTNSVCPFVVKYRNVKYPCNGHIDLTHMKATVYQSIVSEECDTKEYILVISPTLQT